MKQETENTLREAQLAAFGKILAGFTHELKNHLAIINEANGLMGDLLSLEGENQRANPARLARIIETIAERISLANCITNHLNSFAHRMDKPFSTFSINDVLTEGVALLARLGRLKNVSLTPSLQKKPPEASTDPALLHFVVFSLLQTILGAIDNGGEISITGEQQQNKTAIRISTPDISNVAALAIHPPDQAQALALALRKMNIQLTEKHTEKGLNFMLIFSA
ncbi:MAG: hypothetical protein HY885_16785 [Deltaproteobacteria bacterium]|nr:hypothetical protein [Deltaproteobacteria bacterium]